MPAVVQGREPIEPLSETVVIFGILLSHYRFCCCLQLFKDLLNPSVEEEKQKHKKKRLVQSPNSYFMDVKCPGKLISMTC